MHNGCAPFDACRGVFARKQLRVRELRYRIHIKIGEQVQTFSCNSYRRENSRIYFTDKFDQPKEFSDTPEVVLGIEDMEPQGARV